MEEASATGTQGLGLSAAVQAAGGVPVRRRDDGAVEVLLVHRPRYLDWTFPKGKVKDGERGEDAALRELREETGYTGEKPRLIGQVFPNPAIMSNICFTIMVENCRCLHPVEFDHGEDLMTRLVPVAEFPGLVAGGKIRHSLVVVALYFFELWQRAY